MFRNPEFLWPKVLTATWFSPSRTHHLPYDLVMGNAHAFRVFTSDTKSCPATHRHGKILQGTHVLPLPSPAGEGCLPTKSFWTASSQPWTQRFCLLEDTSEKTALELCWEAPHHLSLTTNPVVKLRRVRFHNLVHDSQLKKQSRIPSSWKTISIGDLELRRFPRSSLFSEAGSGPKTIRAS